jgi:hypothetical protein
MKLVLVPALTESGVVRFIVKPAPLIVAPVMLSVAFPVLFNVTVCVGLLPTFTLPNATGEGLIANCACVVTAEPLKPIVSGDVAPVFAIDTLPVEVPMPPVSLLAWLVYSAQLARLSIEMMQSNTVAMLAKPRDCGEAG